MQVRVKNIAAPNFFQVNFYVWDFEHELNVLVSVPDPIEESLYRTRDDTFAYFAVNVALHCVRLQ